MKMGYFYSVFRNFGVNLIRTEKNHAINIVINHIITPVKYGKQDSRANR